MFKPIIKGVIRFSYPSEGGFAKDFANATEHEAFLFDHDRLERRFHLFESLTLPSLRGQTDGDYHLAVLTGEGLPAWALKRLQAGLADVPQARIVQLPRMNHYPATREALEQMPDDGATHVAGFRLDDDDAMHFETVERIREIANGMAQITDTEKPFAIGFNRGFFLDRSDRDNAITEVRERSPIGIGLTLVVPIKQRSNVFRRNHRFLHQFYDCYTDVSRPMFIRSVHEDNDSGAVSTGAGKGMTRAEIDTALQSGFGTDLATLKAL
ncbi:MAG: glycosyltransferase [Paracoccaceae bacterium]|nr:glycosyltransferase [Paracoccaceae bacterium]MDG1739373.1 glycosyltransferase [Paracoccaceae bacterium]MDG2257632.1 glycosyltransferase [Paracoccaceae bacterium]